MLHENFVRKYTKLGESVQELAKDFLGKCIKKAQKTRFLGFFPCFMGSKARKCLLEGYQSHRILLEGLTLRRICG